MPWEGGRKGGQCLEISVAAFPGQSVKEVRPTTTWSEKRLVGRPSSLVHRRPGGGAGNLAARSARAGATRGPGLGRREDGRTAGRGLARLAGVHAHAAALHA